MDALKAIFTRKSVRMYSHEKISDETMHTLLRAAMSGPSCVNARDWAFLVVRDKRTLRKMYEANGLPAEPLLRADAAILICSDLTRSFSEAKDYSIIDCAIAAQNICLAAHAMGIGAVWLGTYPQMERVEGQAALFGLPEDIIPQSIIALGHPSDDEGPQERDLYEADRVHFERW